MKDFIKILFLFTFVQLVSSACPGCAGSMDNPKEANLVWILSGFILLTYIPFYILYRTVFKNGHLNDAVISDSNPENVKEINQDAEIK